MTAYDIKHVKNMKLEKNVFVEKKLLEKIIFSLKSHFLIFLAMFLIDSKPTKMVMNHKLLLFAQSQFICNQNSPLYVIHIILGIIPNTNTT